MTNASIHIWAYLNLCSSGISPDTNSQKIETKLSKSSNLDFGKKVWTLIRASSVEDRGYILSTFG